MFNFFQRVTTESTKIIQGKRYLIKSINFPRYQFSNGMRQRLAFSIAIHCDLDIILLDEGFEVGDEEFKNKSANKIKELVRNETTVLLVSHNLDLLRKYCRKVI